MFFIDIILSQKVTYGTPSMLCQVTLCRAARGSARHIQELTCQLEIIGFIEMRYHGSEPYYRKVGARHAKGNARYACSRRDCQK